MVRRVEDADDLELVKQANPLAHISPEYLREKRESLTLDYGTDWLRLTCNIPTRSSLAAVPEADWDACESDERIPEGQRVLVGADFAFLEDTTALTPVWVADSEHRLFDDPVILEPPGNGVMLDVNEIKVAFLEIHERNPIEVVVMDSTKAQDIAQWLSDELGCTVIDREQTNAYAVEDYENFMQAVRRRWIQHTGHQLFRRHVLAAIRARLPGDRHRFDRPRTQRKQKRDQRRIVIDALTAASMVNTYIVESAGGTDYGVVVG
jgi:phage terminase large subunit-like protein